VVVPQSESSNSTSNNNRHQNSRYAAGLISPP
jgi:hypothetical protein